MIENDSASITATGPRDRSGRLVFGGVLLCLAGAGAILLGLFSLASMLFIRQLPEVAGASQVGVGQAVSGCVTYLAMGTALLWLGIGSFLRRRWSRPLVLVVAWGWLLTALLAGVMMSAFVPVMARQMPPGPAATLGIYGCMGALVFLFGILAPGVLIGLYRGRDVQATLDTSDPQERWTDHLPLPLLGISVWLGYGAVVSLMNIAHPVLAMGSEILTGPVAALVYVVNAAILGAVAVGLARRSRTAWWVGLLTFIGWGVWAALTFPRLDMDELLHAAGVVQPQPGFDMSAAFENPLFFGGMALAWLAMIAFFVYVRRYLGTSGRPGAAPEVEG